MARPIVGGIRVKKENRVQKNGDIYVYERKVQYDPETRTNKTISRTLLGVKHPGSDEIQKTRRLLRNNVKASSTDSTGNRITTRKKIGLVSLLEWVGEASDIDSDIRVAFGVDSELASQCIAIARFWVATNGATLPNMRTWQIKHGVSSEELISESIYGTVFETIGQHENYSQNYFKCRCNGLSRETVIAIDTTTTSNVICVPVDENTVLAKRDIVLCKANGHYYLHLIWSLKPGDRFLIGNNHNHPNGVISRKNIFGKVVEIL